MVIVMVAAVKYTAVIVTCTSAVVMRGQRRVRPMRRVARRRRQRQLLVWQVLLVLRFAIVHLCSLTTIHHGGIRITLWRWCIHNPSGG